MALGLRRMLSMVLVMVPITSAGNVCVDEVLPCGTVPAGGALG